jgi:tellurite methyltransferase
MSYAAGRQETLRYHREFYRDVELFAPGSWLAGPARYILESIRFTSGEDLRVLDLGAGVGRH